jgi:hypothetical protein
MSVVTNVSPYFDDYSEDKNFHRVLFKPGVAVQARELTQSQTILQNQIKRIGDTLYVDGSKVSGGQPNVNENARTIRLTGKDVSGKIVSLENLLGTYVVSSENDVLGYVEFVYEANDPAVGDPPSIVISLQKFNNVDNGLFSETTELYFYTNYINALNRTTPNYTAITSTNIVKNATSTTTEYSKIITLTNPSTIIEEGDFLIHPNIRKKLYVTSINSSLEIEVNEPVGIVIDKENIQYVKLACSPTLIVTQDESYYYKNGFLLRSNKQKIIPNKNTAFPSKLLAFSVDETIVNSSDDSSLLDPAIGSSNYFAPGADRLQFNLSLVSYDLTAAGKADTTDNFIPLIKFNRGAIEYLKAASGDSILQDTLATRTYEESGNYVVNPFLISPIHTNDAYPNLIFSISGGLAYVGGYRVNTTDATRITIPKPSTTETKTNYNITTTQGNYIKVVDVDKSLIKPENIIQGEVFLEAHSVKNPANANTLLGTFVYKGMEYDSSLDSTTQFRMFFHNFSLKKDVPATWGDWATKYGVIATEGQYISNTLYYTTAANVLLGQYGVAKTNCYGLYREPGVDEVYFWWKRWDSVDNRDIAKTKEAFALSILNASSTRPDYARLTSNSKVFLASNNGSVFLDGLINAKQVKSIVGVNNSSTTHYTAATYASPFFYANVSNQGLDSNNNIIIFDPRNSDKLVFPVSKSYTKTIQNIKTQYNKTARNAVFSGGKYTKQLTAPETFALGNGTIVASTARLNFIILIKSGATASVPLGIFNFNIGSVTISGDSSTVSIDLGDASFSGIADIIYVVESDNLPARTKTLVKNQTKLINIDTAEQVYSLGYSDITQFNGLYKIIDYSKYKGAWDPATSYTYNDLVLSSLGNLYRANVPSINIGISTSNTWLEEKSLISKNWVLSNGQADNWYDHGSVKYIGATGNLPGNTLISFNYFTHTGEGPVTVDSYLADYYVNIPQYRSVVDANELELRDCLDFRPRRIDNSSYLNFDSAVYPTSIVNTEIDLTYYLGRIDKIYLTNNPQKFDSPYNNFFIEVGQTAVNKNVDVSDLDKSRLIIATLEIPPYTVSGFDVSIVYADNTRYTMADIGRLNSRTKILDKQVKLHSVEIQQLKSIITNDNGDALLKTGIFVENFKSFNRADLSDPYFRAALSTESGTCAPLFSIYDINLKFTDITQVNIKKDIVTLPYSEEVFISQLDGNTNVNPNPGAINDGRGRAVLSQDNSYSVNWVAVGLALGLQYLVTGTLVNFALGLIGLNAAVSTALVTGGFTSGVTAAFSQTTAPFIKAYNWLETKAQSAYNTVSNAIWGPSVVIPDPASVNAFSESIAAAKQAAEVAESIAGGTAESIAAAGEAAAAAQEAALLAEGASYGGSGYSITAASEVGGVSTAGTGAGATVTAAEAQVTADIVATSGTQAVATSYAAAYEVGLSSAAASGYVGTQAATYASSYASSIAAGIPKAIAVGAAEDALVYIAYDAAAAGAVAGASAAASAGASASAASAAIAAGGAEAGAAAAAGSSGAYAASASFPPVAVAIAVVVGIDILTKGEVGRGLAAFNHSVNDGLAKADDELNRITNYRKWLSDIRVKENIKFERTLTNGLNLYSYEYKNKFKKSKYAGDGRYLGYMAHEVEQLYPEAIVKHKNGYMMVDYSNKNLIIK